MKKIFIFVLMVISLLTAPALAAEKLISATGMYIAGASESLNDAKHNALNDAMRQATEQAGVLVNSYSKTHNMELTDDEVTVVATKIIKVTKKRYDVVLLSDSEIKVTAYIDAIVNTESINEDIVELKNKNQKLERQTESLQKELRGSKEAIINVDKLNKEIINTYRSLGGYIEEKKLWNDSPWQDFLSNFYIDMGNYDYSGAHVYIDEALFRYKRTKVPAGFDKTYIDDIVLDLDIKYIENHIAGKKYNFAFSGCYFIERIIDMNNYGKYVNSDIKKKLRRYKEILEGYYHIYQPQIINIYKEHPHLGGDKM